MAKYTNKYEFGYFEYGDTTNAAIESERWRTIDAQMYGLFDVLGDGVVEGWDFSISDNDALVLSVSPGSGHVGLVSVQTSAVVQLVLAPEARNYVYAVRVASSYYTRVPTFVVSVTQESYDTYLYLGYVDTAAVGVSPIILDTNVDDRVYISFKQQILDLIKDHRHIGGTTNPAKINLATDVQGFLREDNIEELDASFIITGTIDQDRLPKIDHIEGLTYNGVLTHAQLDTFVQILSQEGARLMGETSSVDLLKLILAVKHVYPEIDDYLVNELAFIPGISPDDVVDQVNTTAIVDYRPSSGGGQHTITGTPADSTSTFTKDWDTEAEFDEAVLDDTVVVGDSIRLTTKDVRAYIEDFEDISDWETITTDLSSVSSNLTLDAVLSKGGIYSAKLDINTDDVEIAFILKKTFALQDWSNYSKIVFQFYCDSAEHGDIYFYLYDAIAGSQGSYTMILERNAPTIDRETLAVGWREIVIDISKYTRQSVTAVGFYTSTSAGWSVKDSFSFNIDDMYLTSGNVFIERGTAIFSFGNDFEYVFSAVRWDASEPEGTSIKVRTRVSDDPDMSSAIWSSFITVSGGSIVLPSVGIYKYIELEATLETNLELDKTPQLYALYLDCYVTSSDREFSFETKDAWDAGSLNNIDTESKAGSISIKNIGDLGTYVYGEDGVMKQLNPDMSGKLSIYGVSVPRSFTQMLNDTVAEFGQISAVTVGLHNSFIVADTDNDRVVEIDKSGNVLWGLMGVFHTTPVNPYAEKAYSTAESTGQSSSTSAQSSSTSGQSSSGTSLQSSTSGQSSSTSGQSSVTQTVVEFYPVGAYYNIEDSMLSVMFNKDLENIYTSTTFNPSDMFLKAGTRRIYLDSTKCIFSLFGMDEEHIGQTVASSDASQYMTGSNVLQVVLSEADAVTIFGASASSDPYLVAVHPTKNEVVTASSLTVEFEAYNCTIGEDTYGIRVQLDGEPTIDLWSVTHIEFTGLADGSHSVQATLIDSNRNALATAEAQVTIGFYVETGSLAETIINVESPKQNQVLDSGTFSIEYLAYNIPSGYFLWYAFDGGTASIYSGSSPILVEGLAAGDHTLRMYFADISNVVDTGLFSDVSVDFVVVSKTGATFSVLMGAKSIKDSAGNEVEESVVGVDVTKIRIGNIYAPVDVDLVTTDSTEGDASEFNVLIAKCATPSYLNYYGLSYRDGHSVAEYSQAGKLVMSNNLAVIAANKTDAKTYLGSVVKYGSGEIFIGDPNGKRAIVVELDTTNKTSTIIWAYDSDKMISDFNRVPDVSGIVNIDDSGIDNSEASIRRDVSVTWYNNTNETVRILSGATTYVQFYQDPDLDLFGSEFDSGDVLPGEYYSFRFLNIGTFDYFVYPFIFTGSVSVIETSITPNDTFVLAENDPSGSSYLNRVLKIDAWGNIVWSFGEAFVSLVKDAKPTSSGEIVITV